MIARSPSYAASHRCTACAVRARWADHAPQERPAPDHAERDRRLYGLHPMPGPSRRLSFDLAAAVAAWEAAGGRITHAAVADLRIVQCRPAPAPCLFEDGHPTVAVWPEYLAA